MQGLDNMENLPIFRLTIKEDETAVQEVNAVALVDIPAIGRRQDQMILDALNAATSTGTVANSIGGTNTNYSRTRW